MKRLRRHPLVQVLGSFQLGLVALGLLFVLTLVGTFHQVEHGLYLAQQRYFASWIAPLPIAPGLVLPIPGGITSMTLLALNLVVGAGLRLRWSLTGLGLLCTHLGILMLLAAGLVSFVLGREGSVQLYEGQETDEFRSWNDWELAVIEDTGNGLTEHLVDHRALVPAWGGQRARLDDPALPFVLEVGDYRRNAFVVPAGIPIAAGQPTAGGAALLAQAQDQEASRNRPGAIATVIGRDGASVAHGIVWDGAGPLRFEHQGRAFALDLRKDRHDLGFRLELLDFEHRFHPGTRRPASFESLVKADFGNEERQQRIIMNHPLRRHGLVVYQSSWGPQDAAPGSPLFSGFAVVFNPADQWPLYACIVIALGMAAHFLQALVRSVNRGTPPVAERAGAGFDPSPAPDEGVTESHVRDE